MKWLQFLLKLSVTVTLVTIASAETNSSSASVLAKEQNLSLTRLDNNSQNQILAQTLTSDLNVTKSTNSLVGKTEISTTPTGISAKFLLALIGLGATASIFYPRIILIKSDEVGIVYKKFGRPLPSNNQIALNGEMGIQIATFDPGRHFLFRSWMYEIVKEKAIEIDTDEIGIVKAKDGASLPPGKMFGKVVECDDFQDGRAFITGGGQRGQQLGILRHGIYRLNTKLFEVEISTVTHIHGDEIGLAEAKDGKPLPSGRSFGAAVDCNNFQNAQAFINNGGYRGKQLKVLTTGKYAINTELFKIHRVNTIKVGTNEVGIVEAKDGQPLPIGHDFGRVVDCNDFQDAEAFINNGGQRGKQLAILSAGIYDINTELFNVCHIPVVKIPSGEIGLILAQDGASKPSGQILGNTVDCDNFQHAEAFINNGGQKGKQRAILTSGTYRINTELFTVITSENAKKHDMKPADFKLYTVESDKIGIVTTFDGKPLDSGNIAAPIIDGQNKFQDGQQFIDEGGYRGLQEELLEEGSWKLNPWFVKVKQIPLTEIKAGTVGVVISNIGENVEQIEDINTDKSGFNIVPRGYKGIEEIPLEAGKYPINTRVKSIVIVPTHEITLDWANKDKEATDYDSNLRTLELHSKDGFSFELEVTQVINIAAINAPKMISRVGSTSASTIDKIIDIVTSDDAVKYSSIENLVIRVLEPMVGSYFRDAAQKFDALDFLKKRDEIQEEATEHIKMALNAYGVQAVATLINEINLPEELEVPIKNITIAQIKKGQFIEEQKTEKERQKLEKEKQITESQAEFVKAERDTEIAEEEAKRLKIKAEAETNAQKIKNDEEIRVMKEKEEIEATKKKLILQLELDKLAGRAQTEAMKQKLEKELELTVFQETLKTLSPELYAKMETDKMWADAFSKFKFTAPQTLINGSAGNNNSDGLNSLYSGEFQMQLLGMMTDRWSNNRQSDNLQSNNSPSEILPSDNLQPNNSPSEILPSDNFQPDCLNPENSIEASLDDIEED